MIEQSNEFKRKIKAGQDPFAVERKILKRKRFTRSSRTSESDVVNYAEFDELAEKVNEIDAKMGEVVKWMKKIAQASKQFERSMGIQSE